MAEAQQVYNDLRNMALHATDVRSNGEPIAGVVVDIPREGAFVSISSLGDGTTSLYTSTGGGAIGAGNYDPVAQATGNLLSTAASHEVAFADVDTGDWPPAGSVRFHLVSSHGNRYIDVPEASFWGRKPHDLMPMIEAAQAVLTGIRQRPSLGQIRGRNVLTCRRAPQDGEKPWWPVATRRGGCAVLSRVQPWRQRAACLSACRCARPRLTGPARPALWSLA